MIFKAITKKHAESKLYGDIGDWFINGDSFTSLLEEVENRGFEELTLRMHCFGGSVFDGNVMYNAMQRSNLKIDIVIDGIAASMACFILSAIENVFIAENGFGMLHRPSSMQVGDADDMTSTAKLLNDMEANFIKTLVERTKLSAEDIKTKFFDGKDHWLNADEMVELGLAKGKVPATAKNIKDLNKEIVANMTIDSVYSKFSACLDKSNTNQKKTKMNLELLIAAFSLAGLTAQSSETEVLAALTAKFKTMSDSVERLENEAKAKAENIITAMVEKAVAEGKIKANAGQTIDQARATYETIGKTAGAEALATVFEGMTARIPIAGMIKMVGAVAPEGGVRNWDWYQKNDTQALAQMEKENPEQFKELYKAEYGSYPA